MPSSTGRSAKGGVDASDLRRTDPWQGFRTGDFGQKWNSSKLILKQGKDAIAPLLTLLSDPTADAETHWFTIRALGSFPEPEVITAIAAQIDDNPRYHRTSEQTAEISAFAIETLAAMGPLAIDALSQLLQNPQQRLLAAKALNQVRTTGVIPVLAGVANDPDARVRYYAIDALGSFHNAAVTPVLLAAIGDPSAAVRKAAVMALGRRSDLQAQHRLNRQLEPLLWDMDLGVSCQTALALGRLGHRDSLAALQQELLSAHTPMDMQVANIRALAWFCDRADRDAALTLLIKALQQFDPTVTQTTAAPANRIARSSQDSSQVQIAIIRVLGDLQDGDIAPDVTTVLLDHINNHPAVSVIQAGIMALAKLGQPQTFEALLPLLNHPVDAVTIHTIAALKRLDPDQSLNRVTGYISQLPQRPTAVLDLW